MNWDDLRTFLAVARTGRVSVAARQLGVEHTTVSRRLAALEHHLDGPLFHRTVAGYRLTAMGDAIVPAAEAMQRSADGILARARESVGRLSGRVRVAMPPEFASHWLAPSLPAFRRDLPGIDLQILVGTRQRDLSRGEAELAIQSPRPRQVGLVAARLGRSWLGLYASRSLAGRKRLKVENLAGLRGLPLLVYGPQFQILQNAPWFQPLLAAAHVLLETNSTHALLEAARQSLGIAVLPSLVARLDPALVLVSAAVAEPEVWLVTHPEYRRDPAVRATADFLKQLASGPDGFA